MTVSIPLTITKKMRQDLKALGFSDDQIHHMKPEDAWQHLGGMPQSKKFDPLDWQSRYEQLLSELVSVDEDLTNELYSHNIAKIKARLRSTDDAPLTLYTAREILEGNWPEPTWAVPGYLSTGLCILAGKPKVGKSWLALQIAHAVASGGIALDQEVQQGTVMYLALEDTQRRLQDRMKKQGWNSNSEDNAEFMVIDQFYNQVGDLKENSHIIASQIKNKGYRMVVIDTLSRSIAGDQNDAAEMTGALAPLQGMAHRYNCVVMLVDHHRKGMGMGPDAITDILGSTAKGAMCDTAWGLYRERGQHGANLAITGRDVNETTLKLTMNWGSGIWNLDGEAGLLEMTEQRSRILEAIEDLGNKAQLPAIARATGLDKGNLYRQLSDLASDLPPKIIKIGTGRGNVYYSLPPDNYDDDIPI